MPSTNGFTARSTETVHAASHPAKGLAYSRFLSARRIPEPVEDSETAKDFLAAHALLAGQFNSSKNSVHVEKATPAAD
jgi:hypothetical protein